MEVEVQLMAIGICLMLVTTTLLSILIYSQVNVTTTLLSILIYSQVK